MIGLIGVSNIEMEGVITRYVRTYYFPVRWISFNFWDLQKVALNETVYVSSQNVEADKLQYQQTSEQM